MLNKKGQIGFVIWIIIFIVGLYVGYKYMPVAANFFHGVKSFVIGVLPK